MVDLQSILISGASSGVGRATAILLAGSDMRVFGGVRRDSDAASLQTEGLPNLVPVKLDVTDVESIQDTIDQISNQVGERGLYAIINNAGIALGGPIEFTHCDVWRRQFEVNVMGTLNLVQKSLPLLRRCPNSRIVNIGSIAGLFSAPHIAPYCASKFALEAVTASLRMELAQWRIHATIIAPGNVNTPIWGKAQADSDSVLSQLSDNQLALYGEQLKSMAKHGIAAGRKGVDPEDVAQAVLRSLRAKRPRHRYLVGPDARMIYILSKVLPRSWIERLILRRLGISDQAVRIPFSG